MSIVELTEQIPSELIRLSSSQYAEYISGIAAIRWTVQRWQQVDKPGYTKIPPFIRGLRQYSPVALIRQALAVCPDESSSIGITELNFISDGAFPGLAPCSTVPAGQVQFSIHGVPNDNALKQPVHTHEDHHVANFKTITNNVLVPWDKKLTDAKTAGKKMVAKDQSVCETRFYAQFVGSQTPNEIVDTIVKQVNSTGQAFHATPAGKS